MQLEWIQDKNNSERICLREIPNNEDMPSHAIIYSSPTFNLWCAFNRYPLEHLYGNGTTLEEAKQDAEKAVRFLAAQKLSS